MPSGESVVLQQGAFTFSSARRSPLVICDPPYGGIVKEKWDNAAYLMPDRLYEVLVETHTNAGDWVFDPCAGGLTTMRAAEKLGRRYVCIEQKKEYIDAALGR